MRICHVSPHLPPDQAANAILPAQLGRWAAEAGHDVRFLSLEPVQGSVAGADLPGSVRRLVLRRSSSAVVRALRIDTAKRTRAVVGALDEVAADVDLLHLHSNGLIVEVAAAWARRHKRPYLLTLYGTEIWHYRRRWPLDPFTRAYRDAGSVTFYSRGLLDFARERGLDRSGLSVVYPPVDEAFAPADEEARHRMRVELGLREPLLVLNVKRLHELAGQRFLVEAFAGIARQRSDVRLVICGTGQLRTPLEEQARSAGVSDKITFTGLIPNQDVARYAMAADVFVLPSLLEALPTVAVEALAAGTPVVSADHPGGVELHALFGDDVALVQREDVGGLERAIRVALTPPRRVRSATFDAVRTHFSRSAVESSYLAIYQQVVAEKALSLRQ